MKKIALVVAALLLIFGAYIFLNRGDSSSNQVPSSNQGLSNNQGPLNNQSASTNLALEGAFDRVSNALASIPGVTITQSWAKGDLTTEEFGFSGTMGNTQVIRIIITSNSPVRQYSKERLVEALKQAMPGNQP